MTAAAHWFEAAMNSGAPNLDNVTDPDVIGVYGLEWDGDRCTDCRRPVSDGVERCDDCTEDGPDLDVCANPSCDHQRAFHHPQQGGICLGPDCDCCEFETPDLKDNL